jgi:thiol-disulfide isomerase/thioredoxin
MGRLVKSLLVISFAIAIAFIIQGFIGSPTEDSGRDLNVGGNVGLFAPELGGVGDWINSEPLRIRELEGRVVLVDFWTFSCRNCINTLPYLKGWHEKYTARGLVLIGVHSPEFRFEKDIENLKTAIAEHGIRYPVVQDNDFAIWRAYGNRYWPHKYLIDKQGVIRYHHIGEGAYNETEEWIVRLLNEAGTQEVL